MILTFIAANWVWLSPIAYELAARLIRTKKDYSLLNAIKKGADAFITNKRK